MHTEHHGSSAWSYPQRMSNMPNGPGWWQASDGQWYPPQSHPANSPQAQGQPGATPSSSPISGATYPPAAPPPQAGYTPAGHGGQMAPGGPYGGPPPKKSGMPGWLKAILIIGGVLIVGVGGCTVVVGTILSRKISSTSMDLAAGCEFLSASTATSALGSGQGLIPLKGLAKLAGVALDNRVLSGAPSCLLSPTDTKSGYTGRVARLQSADAAKLFKTEVDKSHGTKVDKGGGLTVESEGYYGSAVEVGDEAFCTTGGMPPSSGILIRKGDTLVYVSLLPTQPQLDDVSNGGLTTVETTNCEVAQKLAKAILSI